MRDLLDRTGAIPVSLLASLRSPAGKRARLSILIYHRVLDKPDLLTEDLCDTIFLKHKSVFCPPISMSCPYLKPFNG